MDDFDSRQVLAKMLVSRRKAAGRFLPAAFCIVMLLFSSLSFGQKAPAGEQWQNRTKAKSVYREAVALFKKMNLGMADRSKYVQELRDIAKLFHQAGVYYAGDRDSRDLNDGSNDICKDYFPAIREALCYWLVGLQTGNSEDLQRVDYLLTSRVDLRDGKGTGIYNVGFLKNWVAASRLASMDRDGTLESIVEALKAAKRIEGDFKSDGIQGGLAPINIDYLQQTMKQKISEAKAKGVPRLTPVAPKTRWVTESSRRSATVDLRVLGTANIVAKLEGGVSQVLPSVSGKGSGEVTFDFDLPASTKESYLVVSAKNDNIDGSPGSEVRLGPFLTIAPPSVTWKSSQVEVNGITASATLNVTSGMNGDKVSLKAIDATVSPSEFTVGDSGNSEQTFKVVVAPGGLGKVELTIERKIGDQLFVLQPTGVNPNLVVVSKPRPIISGGLYTVSGGPQRGTAMVVVEDYADPILTIDGLSMSSLQTEKLAGTDGRNRYRYAYPFIGNAQSVTVSYKGSILVSADIVKSQSGQMSADELTAFERLPAPIRLVTDGKFAEAAVELEKLKASMPALVDRLSSGMWAYAKAQADKLKGKDLTEFLTRNKAVALLAGAAGTLSNLQRQADEATAQQAIAEAKLEEFNSQLELIFDATVVSYAQQRVALLNLNWQKLSAGAVLESIQMGDVTIPVGATAGSNGLQASIPYVLDPDSKVQAVKAVITDKKKGEARKREKTINAAFDFNGDFRKVTDAQSGDLKWLLTGVVSESTVPDWKVILLNRRARSLVNAFNQELDLLAKDFTPDKETVLADSRVAYSSYYSNLAGKQLAGGLASPASLDNSIRARFPVKIVSAKITLDESKKPTSASKIVVESVRPNVTIAAVNASGVSGTVRNNENGKLTFDLEAKSNLEMASQLKLVASLQVAGVPIRSDDLAASVAVRKVIQVGFADDQPDKFWYTYTGESKRSLVFAKAKSNTFKIVFNPNGATSIKWSLRKRGSGTDIDSGAADASSRTIPLPFAKMSTVGRYDLSITATDDTGESSTQVQPLTVLGTGLAFVAGNDFYGGVVKDLNYAAKDAKDFVKMLEDVGYDEASILYVRGEKIVNGGSTESKLISNIDKIERGTQVFVPAKWKMAIDVLISRIRATDCHHLIFYVAGHGELIEVQRNFKEQMIFMGGIDIKTQESQISYTETVSSLVKLMEAAAAAEPKESGGKAIPRYLVAINDACRKSSDSLYNPILGTELVDVVPIYACKPDQAANEPVPGNNSPGLQNGFFAHSIRAALSSNVKKGDTNPKVATFYKDIDESLQSLVRATGSKPQSLPRLQVATDGTMFAPQTERGEPNVSAFNSTLLASSKVFRPVWESWRYNQVLSTSQYAHYQTPDERLIGVK